MQLGKQRLLGVKIARLKSSLLHHHFMFLLLRHLIRCSANTQCSKEDTSSLLEVKKSLSISPDKHKLHSWKLGSNCCEWEGITCNFYSSQVTGLDLSMHGFSGSIGDILFNLASLQYLNLAYNHFDSINISLLLGRLSNLTNLNASNSGVAGYFEEFPASSSLKRIDLSNNQLQGQIPKSLFSLTNLRFLVLASNNFSGVLKLNSFFRLKKLAHLDLSNNKLSIRDADSNSSTLFPKLRTLKLISCGLINIPYHLKHQENMVNLDLSNNQIIGNVPTWIWGIGNQTLMNLNLSYNMLKVVENFKQDFIYNSLYSPIILDISSNMLQGSIPLPPRDTILLDNSNNNFSSIIPYNISFYLNSTIFLSLAKNNLSGEIPTTICKARFLQVIELSDNHFGGTIPSCILYYKNDLIVLNLSGNKLQGTIPQHINRKYCGLKTINLNRNNLTGGVPRSLAYCDKLEVIDFGNNRLSDIFPFWLGNIYILQILVLRSNEFYGSMFLPLEIPHDNYTFTKLQILDLSSNKFNGVLPVDCFPNLKAMMDISQQNKSSIVGELLHPQTKQLFEGYFYQDTLVVTSKGQDTKLVKILTIYKYIDLSNNKFEGDIPYTMGLLQSLIVLNLSHNALTGKIPSTFGNLSSIESLDLSGNHLSGQIPQELTLLTFLSSLNLSNNDLVGKIPQGSQFSTFTSASFQGNKGSCGSPLLKPCYDTTPSISEFDGDESSESRYEIETALSVGIGFGFGIGLVFVIQTMPTREYWKKLRKLMV